MVIYIQYKFHEIPSIAIGYLVMAEDEKTDGQKHQTEGRTDKTKPLNIPPPSAGDKKIYKHYLASMPSY